MQKKQMEKQQFVPIIIIFYYLMSKTFSKQKNTQSRTIPLETWSAGDQHYNNLFKLSKPPRRNENKFMTTEHDQYQQSHKQQGQSEDNTKVGKKQHRRRTSNHSRNQKTEGQDEGQGLFYNPQYKSFNNTPKLKRNESKQKVPDSSKQIEVRFREIESIMGLENQNLRQQKDYLLKTIYRMQLKQKQYKNKLAEYQDRTLELEEENAILREKYEKARDFIANGIGKMEQVISKQPVENLSNSNTAHHSNESSVNVSQQIEELNDKFDALMYEYQKTRQPEIRKKCMEMAKELRKLRKTQNGIQNNKKK